MILNVNRKQLFNLFKYVTYLLLTYNIYLFFNEESASAVAVYPNGVALENIIDAFSSTIDTVAWVILLWLFELETAVIPDDKLKGALKWWLMVCRAVCYCAIFYAVSGYFNEYMLMADYELMSVTDACSLVGSNLKYIEILDTYHALNASNCQALSAQPLYQVTGTELIGTETAVKDAAWLAFVDVINSNNWVLILIILEIDVYLQLKGITHARVIAISNGIKAVLYLTLFGCAAYWGVNGDFLDFWDAFLWLVAFIFIELNIFNWREETDEAAQHAV